MNHNFFQEYSLIMSERDTVHKEIEKLQEEVSVTKKKMTVTEAKAKGQEEDVSTRKIIQ